MKILQFVKFLTAWDMNSTLIIVKIHPHLKCIKKRARGLLISGNKIITTNFQVIQIFLVHRKLNPSFLVRHGVSIQDTYFL